MFKQMSVVVGMIMVLALSLIGRSAQADEITSLVHNLNQVQAYQDFIYKNQVKKARLSYARAGEIARAVAVSSANHDIPMHVIIGVMQTESGFDIHARSRSGALGLMQVVPYWHKKTIAGRSLFNIDDAVDIGTEILAQYLKKAQGSQQRMLGYYCGYRGKSRFAYIGHVRYKAMMAFSQVQKTQLAYEHDRPQEGLGSPNVEYSSSVHFSNRFQQSERLIVV
jgi:soluble lytic murein transglycosylase-like protein